MDPDSKEKDTFNLPPPAQEGGQSLPEQPHEGRTEMATSQALEQGNSAPPPMPPMNDQGAPQSVPPSQQGYASDDPHNMASLSAAMPQIADDTDLIEKEWVDKAKAIVEQTAHDPYLQNQEINKVKVDYLKKRYNKDVKLTDD